MITVKKNAKRKATKFKIGDWVTIANFKIIESDGLSKQDGKLIIRYYKKFVGTTYIINKFSLGGYELNVPHYTGSNATTEWFDDEVRKATKEEIKKARKIEVAKKL